MTASLAQPNRNSDTYRHAYGRINGLVVVGEGLADRHFRLLARAIPEDREELERLAAMEGRHARDFVDCGRQAGVPPDLGLARRLFAPLHALFLRYDRAGNRSGCLVIQGLIVECFALAAYRHYLPVADPYSQGVTAAVMADETEHLSYAESWLAQRFTQVQAAVEQCCAMALPMPMSMLQTLAGDLRVVGIEPVELLATFSELFQGSLELIGFTPSAARRILIGAAATAAAGSARAI